MYAITSIDISLRRYICSEKKKKNNKVEKILAFETKMRIFDVIPALQRETLYVKTQIKLVDVTPEEIYNKLSSLQIGQNTYN